MNRAALPADPPPARHAEAITQGLELLQRHVPLRKRLLHAGDALYRAGARNAHAIDMPATSERIWRALAM